MIGADGGHARSVEASSSSNGKLCSNRCLPHVPFEEEKVTPKNGYFMEFLNTEPFLGFVRRRPEVRKISTSQKDSPSECFMEGEKLVKSSSQIQH